MFSPGTKKTRSGLKFNRSFLYVPVIWNAPLLDKENPIRVIKCRKRVIIEWHNYSDLVFRTQTPSRQKDRHEARRFTKPIMINMITKNCTQISKTLRHNLFQATFQPFHIQRPTCTLSAARYTEGLIIPSSDINGTRVNDANTEAGHWTWPLASEQSTFFLAVFSKHKLTYRTLPRIL